jgi:hypothetical protein
MESNCTGDVHVGLRVVTYEVAANDSQPARTFDIHHRGVVNARAALDWLYNRDLDPSLVFVAGNSAAALGSSFHVLDIAEHYADARVEHSGDAAGTHATNLRLSQINYHADEVQLSFLALKGVEGVPLIDLLDSNLVEISNALPTFRSYTITGDAHSLLLWDPFYETEVDGVRLRDWVADLVAGEEIPSVMCEECR